MRAHRSDSRRSTTLTAHENGIVITAAWEHAAHRAALASVGQQALRNSDPLAAHETALWQQLRCRSRSGMVKAWPLTTQSSEGLEALTGEKTTAPRTTCVRTQARSKMAPGAIQHQLGQQPPINMLVVAVLESATMSRGSPHACPPCCWRQLPPAQNLTGQQRSWHAAVGKPRSAAHISQPCRFSRVQV